GEPQRDAMVDCKSEEEEEEEEEERMARMGWVELIIHSATDLKDVKTIGTMHTYVMASIQRTGLTYSQNEDVAKAMTPPDPRGGCNPTWEHPLTLSFTCRDLTDLNSSAFLLIRILAAPSRLSPSPTPVGATLVPFSVITCQTDPSSGQPLCLTGTWQRSTSRVQRLSGRYQGFLTFSVRVRLQEGPFPFSSNSSFSYRTLSPVSSMRSQLGHSTAHIDPTAPSPSFPSSGAPSSLYDSGDMAGAFVVGALAVEAWDMAGWS
ncbi:hypothetical protein GOP47_0020396, partial [Adiantum capillus-veneris]